MIQSSHPKGLSQIVTGARIASKNGYLGHFRTEPERAPSDFTQTISTNRTGPGVSWRIHKTQGRKQPVEGHDYQVSKGCRRLPDGVGQVLNNVPIYRPYPASGRRPCGSLRFPFLNFSGHRRAP